jgi:hypothetical protein
MEVSGQLHALAALPPGTHWIGGWVGRTAGVETVEKRKIFRCREWNPDWARRYNDWAIQTPCKWTEPNGDGANVRTLGLLHPPRACPDYFSTPKMVSACSTETSDYFYHTTWHHILSAVLFIITAVIAFIRSLTSADYCYFLICREIYSTAKGTSN